MTSRIMRFSEAHLPKTQRERRRSSPRVTSQIEPPHTRRAAIEFARTSCPQSLRIKPHIMNDAQCIADAPQYGTVAHQLFCGGAPHFSAAEMAQTPRKYGSAARRNQGNPPNPRSLPNCASRLAVPAGCLVLHGTGVPQRQSVMPLFVSQMGQDPSPPRQTEPAG